MDNIFVITAEEFESKANQYSMYASSDLDYTGRMVYFASESSLDFDKAKVVELISEFLKANNVAFNCRRDDILFKR